MALGLAALILILAMVLFSCLHGPALKSKDLRSARTTAEEAEAERAFLKAQLALAGTDSINIVLDAREQKLWIVLKGVRLRECRLLSVRLDSAIRSLVRHGREEAWVDRPFTLVTRRGDLPDPWQPIQEGPVDTLIGPTLARELPMDGNLVFDRSLVVHIETPPTAADSLRLRGLSGVFRRMGRRVHEAGEAFHEIFFGPPTLDVYVRIRRDDGAAVLRALPLGGGMALHL